MKSRMIINQDGVGFSLYDFKEKVKAVNDLCQYMLVRTQSMFEYKNLPSTIPQKFLEMYIQYYGVACVFKYEDNLYVSYGGWGGVPNEYYQPTQFIVSNPYLKISKTFEVDKDCVLIFNDSMYMGLKPLLEKYATALIDNELTMWMVNINTRKQELISADDDSTKASAELYLKRLIDGELSVIANNHFMDSLQVHPASSSSTSSPITNLIEYEQYLKAGLWNELGLNANYNMKRESINSNEAQLNDDMLLPLIDNMLRCRKDAVDKINKMFNTNITVDFASAWKDNVEELEAKQDLIEGGREDEEETKSGDSTMDE